MNVLFASDIHGNTERLNFLVKKCIDESVDRFVLTGDVTGFWGRDISDILMPVKTITSVVFGNCDNESHLLSCGVLCDRDYGVFHVDGFNIFYTHGHIYNETKTPPGMRDGDVLVCGHTHIPKLEQKNGFLSANPGSLSRPRGGFVPTYMMYTDGCFCILDTDDNVLFSNLFKRI